MSNAVVNCSRFLSPDFHKNQGEIECILIGRILGKLKLQFVMVGDKEACEYEEITCSLLKDFWSKFSSETLFFFSKSSTT